MRNKGISYYCLADATGHIRRNMPEPIPVLVPGSLVVDVAFQERGVGPMLLLHAPESAQEAAKVAGIRALVVHAKDESAAEFYKRFGFVESPLNPLMLMVRVELVALRHAEVRYRRKPGEPRSIPFASTDPSKPWLRQDTSG